jgi:RsiW-degrading membrane proteinase PrsW (M82 family)
MAARKQDWLSTVKWIAQSMLSSIQIGSFILATLAMLIWGTILMKLCQASRFDKWTPLLCAAALLLGMMSVIPTFFWIILEEMYLPIGKGEDLFHTIVYFIATVGLREEVCKLLLFLPLAPILIKRGYHLEFLLVASFVGLGFAYEENFNYLGGSMGTATHGRFLTANFLHISLTGMSGLFFCRALGTRAYGFNDFFAMFGIVIIAHGLYDAFIVHPPLDDGGFLAMILFIVFSKYYFKEVHELR